MVKYLMQKPNDKKHGYTQSQCVQCGSTFWARNDSLKRGMGKFCSKSCQVKNQHKNGTNKAARKRDKHHTWKGETINAKGYKFINVGCSHPRAYRGMYVAEHVLVAESILGRYLRRGEVVHHIDKNTLNNSPSNLAVMEHGEHTRIHKLNQLDKHPPLSNTAE